MAIIRAKGKNADYIIELGIHLPDKPHTVRTDDYKLADAYMFEGLTNEPLGFIARKQPKILEHAIPNNKSIWLGDVSDKEGIIYDRLKNVILSLPPIVISIIIANLVSKKLKQKLSRRKFLSYMVSLAPRTSLAMLFGFVLSPNELATTVATIKKGEMPKWLTELGITYRDFLKSSRRVGRSAIISHKAEEFVAPTLAQRLGRRPTIYIWMGAAHYALGKLIESPPYREDILRAFSPPENYFYPSYKHTIMGCLEYSPAMDDYELIEHKNIITWPKPKKESSRKPQRKRLKEEFPRRKFARKAFHELTRHFRG